MHRMTPPVAEFVVSVHAVCGRELQHKYQKALDAHYGRARAFDASQTCSLLVAGASSRSDLFVIEGREESSKVSHHLETNHLESREQVLHQAACETAIFSSSSSHKNLLRGVAARTATFQTEPIISKPCLNPRCRTPRFIGLGRRLRKREPPLRIHHDPADLHSPTCLPRFQPL